MWVGTQTPHVRLQLGTMQRAPMPFLWHCLAEAGSMQPLAEVSGGRTPMTPSTSAPVSHFFVTFFCLRV